MAYQVWPQGQAYQAGPCSQHGRSFTISSAPCQAHTNVYINELAVLGFFLAGLHRPGALITALTCMPLAMATTKETAQSTSGRFCHTQQSSANAYDLRRMWRLHPAPGCPCLRISVRLRNDPAECFSRQDAAAELAMVVVVLRLRRIQICISVGR